MDFKTINKILIIRLSSLGDILLTTPLVRSLKKTYPKIKLDFLIKEQYRDTLKYNPYIEKIYSYNNGDELIRELENQKYELIIDLQKNARSKRIVNKLNVKSITFSKRSVDKFLLVNFNINRLKNSPQIPQRYAEALPGFTLDSDGPDIFIPDNIEPTIAFNNKNIGFAPGSRHFSKMWPKENYIELGNMMVRAGYNIFTFGGRSDRSICKEISGQIERAIDLSNDDFLLQTASEMKACSLIVCNDSGLMHTACAVKTPVLVFFGSTVKEFGFTPYKSKNLILENKLLSCRPCSHIGRESCPLGHFRCMLEITPQMAFETSLTLLNS